MKRISKQFWIARVQVIHHFYEHRWLTVVSKERQNGPELVLEPVGFEPDRAYLKSTL